MERIFLNGDTVEGYDTLIQILIYQIQKADNRFMEFNFSKRVFEALIAKSNNSKLYKQVKTKREIITLFNNDNLKYLRVICATAEIFCTIINIFQEGKYRVSVVPGKVDKAVKGIEFNINCMKRNTLLTFEHIEIQNERMLDSNKRNMNDQFKEKPEVMQNNHNTYEVSLYDGITKARIKKIEGDGNCLIRALIDQLRGTIKNRQVTNQEIQEFRNRVAEHMIQNRDKYEPFLIESLEEGGFDKFINSSVRKMGVWLGYEVIVAVSEMYNRNIIVYQDDEPDIVIAGSERREEGTLRIYYTRTQKEGPKNHYESVVEMLDSGKNSIASEANTQKSVSNANQRVVTTEGTHIAKLKEGNQKHEVREVISNKEKNINKVGNQDHQTQQRSLRIASLNVRGCIREEKRIEIDELMTVHSIDVAALQEVNVLGQLIETRNYKWTSSLNRPNKSRGLAFMIRKNSDVTLGEVRIISGSIISAELVVDKIGKIILVNVHSPNKSVGNFLSDVGSLIGKDHIRNKLLLLGDFNAQIGREDVDEEDRDVVGDKLGFERSNDNGEEFKMFLKIHKLINISSKVGENTNVTWKSGIKESQIDHVLISKDSALRVRFIRGFWPNIKTDHKLLIVGLCYDGKKVSQRKQKRKLDCTALKYEVIKKKYSEFLEQQGNEKDEEAGKDINEEYKEIAEKMKIAADEALTSAKAPLTPKRKSALGRLNKALKLWKKHPDLLPYKWEVQNRKEEFQLAQREHREKTIRNFYRDLNDFEVGVRIRKSYNFLREYVKKRTRKNAYIPTRLWNEVLKESEGPSISFVEENDTCPLTRPPTEEEMFSIIWKSCNGKSAGPDGIRIEMIKYADEKTFNRLVTLWQRMWLDNVMPKDLSCSTQIPIPKVSNPKKVEDFRRISLCNVIYKPYAKWVKNRLREFTGDPGLHQAAFTEGRSTDDHIFITRRIMEEYWNGGEQLYIASLDIKKAFDNVKIEKIKDVLLDLKVPTHVIDRVLLCLKEDRAKVKWQNQFSEEVNRGKGIKQGCPLSPFLFNLVMQKIFKDVVEVVPELKLLDMGLLELPLILVFADDVLIIARTRQELEMIVKALEDCLPTVGLEINEQKSHVIIRAPNKMGDIPDTIRLNNKVYKTYKTLRYLGITLTEDLNRPATVKQRCVNAVKASKIVIDFCKQFKPSWEIGKLIYNTVISPALLYGTKVSTLTKRSRKQLAKYEKMIVKSIWNNCRKESGVKLNIKKALNGKTINRRIRVGRISYYGHIKRRPQNHPLKIAYRFKLNRKKEGRPSYTWKVSLNQDLKRYKGINRDEWKSLAKDKLKLKQKAEEIYKQEESEISDGEEDDN